MAGVRTSQQYHPADILNALDKAWELARFFATKAEERGDTQGATLYDRLGLTIYDATEEARRARGGQTYGSPETMRSRVLSSVDQ